MTAYVPSINITWLVICILFMLQNRFPQYLKNGIEYRYFSRYRIEVENSSMVTISQYFLDSLISFSLSKIKKKLMNVNVISPLIFFPYGYTFIPKVVLIQNTFNKHK